MEKTIKPGLWKRVILFLVVLSILACGMAFAFSETSGYRLVLSESKIDLAKGKSIRLTAVVEGAKAIFVWSSADSAVASVNAGGTVTAKENGTTVITCSATIGEEVLSGEVAVTVYTSVQSMKLPQSVTVDVGKKTDALIVSFTPVDATNQQVIWSTDNSDVAAVDENGIVTGICAGTCKITAVSEESVSGNEKPKSATIRVVVLQPADRIEVDQKSVVLASGKTTKISAVVQPDNASNKTVKWSSNNADIAAVNNGIITGKSAGDAVISASVTNADGSLVIAEIPVHIFVPVTAVSINDKAKGVSIYPGETFSLTHTIKPESAEYRDAKWESDDPSIAKVNSVTGTVKGIKPGLVTITAISTEPIQGKTAPKKDTVKVKVLTPVDSFSLNYDKVMYSSAKSKAIKVISISPSNATNKNLIFKSDNRGIATVDEKGRVTPKRTGCCTITVSAADKQGAKKTASIWILDKDQSVKINKSKSAMDDIPSIAKDSNPQTQAHIISLIVCDYMIEKLISDKKDQSFSYDNSRDSYTFIGKDEIWCCVAQKNNSYELYDLITVSGTSYIIKISSVYLNGQDALEKYINSISNQSNWTKHSVSGVTLKTVITSVVNYFQRFLK